MISHLIHISRLHHLWCIHYAGETRQSTYRA